MNVGACTNDRLWDDRHSQKAIKGYGVGEYLHTGADLPDSGDGRKSCCEVLDWQHLEDRGRNANRDEGLGGRKPTTELLSYRQYTRPLPQVGDDIELKQRRRNSSNFKLKFPWNIHLTPDGVDERTCGRAPVVIQRCFRLRRFFLHISRSDQGLPCWSRLARTEKETIGIRMEKPAKLDIEARNTLELCADTIENFARKA